MRNVVEALNRTRSSRFEPLFALAAMVPLVAGTPPIIGGKASDFALSTVDGKSIRLSEVTSNGPAVLVVLRGYPGYQCPILQPAGSGFHTEVASLCRCQRAGERIFVRQEIPG